MDSLIADTPRMEVRSPATAANIHPGSIGKLNTLNSP